jgi:LacI family transcriptional regulator
VADLASCSAATVSRVLNTPELVSPDTAERVRKAVAELGYRPNPFAKGLMTRTSKMFALLLPKEAADLHVEVVRAAEAAAERHGFCLLLARDSRSPRPSPALAGPLHLADGVAQIVQSSEEMLWKDAAAAGLPVVLIDPPHSLEGSTAVDRILIDDSWGTREAVDHLLSAIDPERIHFVGGPQMLPAMQRRAEAFTRRMAEKGHTLRKDQVAYGKSAGEWGYMWAAGFLTNADLAGRGVLCGSDEIALGVLQAARDARIRVPDQLRIIGFGDTRVAPVVRPSLSTVRVPIGEAADAAIDLLLARTKENELPPQTHTISTRLFIRESSDRSAASGGF